MYQIPLKPVPVQKVSTVMDDREITVALRPRLGRLYATVTVDHDILVDNRICRQGEPLVREAYRGLPGDLYFIDTQGSQDPEWMGLGGRFVLVYT